MRRESVTAERSTILTLLLLLRSFFMVPRLFFLDFAKVSNYYTQQESNKIVHLALIYIETKYRRSEFVKKEKGEFIRSGGMRLEVHSLHHNLADR